MEASPARYDKTMEKRRRTRYTVRWHIALTAANLDGRQSDHLYGLV